MGDLDWRVSSRRVTLDVLAFVPLTTLYRGLGTEDLAHGSTQPQGLGNRTLPAAAAGPPEELAFGAAPEVGRIRCRRILGGLLRHYYRAVA